METFLHIDNGLAVRARRLAEPMTLDDVDGAVGDSWSRRTPATSSWSGLGSSRHTRGPGTSRPRSHHPCTFEYGKGALSKGPSCTESPWSAQQVPEPRNR